ncbi:hypothetical protein PVAND_015017 [Polypedilum vanderplanki]|uniref:Uncharacterized protein n=1 Tax=Polypedilum vanderplanki TaxID=319348 RepID=A0A9J6BBF7_POLVA|nr:hypothetical protein PVAND_015017 [Polypedilum vanderplanki]
MNNRNFYNFKNGVKYLISNIGQGISECAGVAMAALKWYFQKPNEELNEKNFDSFVNDLALNAKRFHQIGLYNSLCDNEHDGFHYIEFGYIYHSRTEDLKNLIKLNSRLIAVFESSNSFHHDASLLNDYVEGWYQTNIIEVFLDYIATRNNVVIYSGLHAHYITVLKKQKGFIVVDGYPKFRSIFYEDIITLANDIEAFKGCGNFTFHHLKQYDYNLNMNIIALSDSDENDVIFNSEKNINQAETTEYSKNKTLESNTDESPIKNVHKWRRNRRDNDTSSSDDDSIFSPRRYQKQEKHFDTPEYLPYIEDFSIEETLINTIDNGKIIFQANFGQNINRCAGVAISAVKSFFDADFEMSLKNSDFEAVINNIHNDAEHFYSIGIQNSGLEFDEQIDLESIFNSRTIDHRNVVDISVHNSIVFETSFTASKVVGTIIQLNDYKEYLASDNKLEALQEYFKIRSHAIICSSEQRHFITVFKIRNLYYVFDGFA